MKFKLSILTGILIGAVDGYFTSIYYNAVPLYYAMIALGLFAIALWQGFEFTGVKTVSGFFTSLGLTNGLWSLSWMSFVAAVSPSIMEKIIRINTIGLGLNAFEPFTTYLLTTAGQVALGVGGYYYTVMMK